MPKASVATCVARLETHDLCLSVFGLHVRIYYTRVFVFIYMYICL